MIFWLRQLPVKPPEARTDVILSDWQQAGLRLPSVLRVDKLATIEKATVLRSLGRPSPADWTRISEKLRDLCHEIIGDWARR